MIMCFHFMYMCILPNFKIYMYTSWVICLSCKSIYMDSIVFWDMCVYFLCCQNIHIPWNIIFFKKKFFVVDYTMRYTLELTLCQLVSLDHFNWYQYDSFLYILMFWLYVCMLSNLSSINFYWYYHFIHIYVLFVLDLQLIHILKAQCLY